MNTFERNLLTRASRATMRQHTYELGQMDGAEYARTNPNHTRDIESTMATAYAEVLQPNDRPDYRAGFVHGYRAQASRQYGTTFTEDVR